MVISGYSQRHDHQAAAVIGQPKCTCDCSLPANKPSNLTQAIKAARWSSVAVIITHIVALVVFGFLVLEQWVAAVLNIITASFLLGCFNKLFYITAAILFAVGTILDVTTVEIWMYDASDSDIDENSQAFAIPPALGAIASLMASMAVCMALVNWEKSDTPVVGGVQTGAIQVGQHALIPSVINTTLQPSRGQNDAASRLQSGGSAPV